MFPAVPSGNMKDFGKISKNRKKNNSRISTAIVFAGIDYSVDYPFCRFQADIFYWLRDIASNVKVKKNQGFEIRSSSFLKDIMTLGSLNFAEILMWMHQIIQVIFAFCFETTLFSRQTFSFIQLFFCSEILYSFREELILPCLTVTACWI